MPRGNPGKPRKEKEAKAAPELAPLNLKDYNTSPILEGPATWSGGPALVHQGVALLEGINETILDEALAGTTLKEYVLRRLTPTSVLIDRFRVDEISKILTKRGYEPKIVNL